MPDTPPPESAATSEPGATSPPHVVRVFGPLRFDGSTVAGDQFGLGMFIAGATLLPFLQSLAAVVGTRAGERLDGATHGILRRLLRRELEQAGPGGDCPPRFLETSAGTRIRLSADTPVEALPQLLAMTFEQLEQDSPDTQALVRWTPAGWLATVTRSGQLYDLTWDPEQTNWVADSPPPPAP